jgi:hypothetical protein
MTRPTLSLPMFMASRDFGSALGSLRPRIGRGGVLAVAFLPGGATGVLRRERWQGDGQIVYAVDVVARTGRRTMQLFPFLAEAACRVAEPQLLRIASTLVGWVEYRSTDHRMGRT